MSPSRKQKEANRKNGRKGGVKTPQGKEISKHNATRHGLLSREMVIKSGVFSESQEEFDALHENIRAAFNAEGGAEEYLIEKMAVSYWRQRRLHRFENAVIRQQLDQIERDSRATRDELNRKIDVNIRIARELEEDITRLRKAQADGVASWEEIYKMGWDSFIDHIVWRIDQKGEEELSNVKTEEEVRALIKEKLGWDDIRILEELIGSKSRELKRFQNEIKSLEQQKQDHIHRVEVLRDQAIIPAPEQMDRILRYGSALERQFYRDSDILVKLQAIRIRFNLAPHDNGEDGAGLE